MGLYTLVEPWRLYFAYRGNLEELVPDLSSFLLITVFPQLPLILYLGYVQHVKYPIDSIMGSFHLAILLAELYFGFATMKELISLQTATFMRLVDKAQHEDATSLQK